MNMREKLQELAENAEKLIENSDNPEKLKEVRVAFLGKKGELTAILKSMKDVAPEDRPKVGQMVNDARVQIEKMIDESQKGLEKKIREEKLKKERKEV